METFMKEKLIARTRFGSNRHRLTYTYSKGKR